MNEDLLRKLVELGLALQDVADSLSDALREKTEAEQVLMRTRCEVLGQAAFNLADAAQAMGQRVARF